MKSEFRARRVFLSRDDMIVAHFATCFIALVIYRLLEKKLNEKYTCHEIINGLREINFLEAKGEGYIPCYTRTDFTDDLHETFGFHTDYQIDSMRQMKKIFKKHEIIKTLHTFYLTKKSLGSSAYTGSQAFPSIIYH